MGFIYFDIQAWVKKHDLQHLPEDEYEKIAVKEIKRWKDHNKAVQFDGFVLYEEDIINRIMEEKIPNSYYSTEYWNTKTSLKYAVFCILNEIVISFDYFLFRAGIVDNNPQSFVNYLLRLTNRSELEEVSKIEFKFLMNASPEPLKKQYLTLNYELSILEALLSDYKFESYAQLRQYAENIEDNTKKKLNSGKCSVKHLYEQSFGRKIGRKPNFGELKLLAILYCLEKIGAPLLPSGRRCIFICDIFKHKKMEHINESIYLVKPTNVALDVELFKNEIIKHIEFKKILLINEKTRYLYNFFSEKMSYISSILDNPKLTRKQIKLDLNRIKKLLISLNTQVDKISNKYYEENIFEFTFLRYQKYIFECEREESFETLNFILATKNPTTTPLFEKYTDNNIRDKEIKLNDIDVYIEKNVDEISDFVKIDKKWVNKRKYLIHNLINLMKRFDRTITFDTLALSILLSMFQAIKEVEDNNYKYNNNYRNYSGNQKISILSKLKDMSDDTKKVESVFDYVWMGLVKKWFMHNECKYELWKLARENENIFNRLICKVMNLNNLNGIDILTKILDLELKFPLKYSRFEYVSMIKNVIWGLTTYKLVIKDLRILAYLDDDAFFDEFISVTSAIICRYDMDHIDKDKESYHINLGKISIKVIQNYKSKIIIFVEVRIIGNYIIYQTSLDLGFKCISLNGFDF